MILILAVCLLEAVLSGRSIDHPVPKMRNWVFIGGLLFSLFIVTALAIKTSLKTERFLFVFVSIAIIVWTILAVALPSQEVSLVLRWIILLMWTCSTISGIAILWEGGKP